MQIAAGVNIRASGVTQARLQGQGASVMPTR